MRRPFNFCKKIGAARENLHFAGDLCYNGLAAGERRFSEKRKEESMKNAKLLAGAGLAAVFAASGCATITRGTHEKVTIVSSPEQALCRIYRESTGRLKDVATPGAVYIPRSPEPIKVVCSKEGYETASVVAAPTTNGVLIGNTAASAFFPAALAGAAFDVNNGANRELPEVIVVNMEPE